MSRGGFSVLVRGVADSERREPKIFATPLQGAQAEIMTQKHATVFLCYVSHGSHMRCGIIDVIISYFQV